MPDIGELVDEPNQEDKDNNANCPFCYEASHPFESRQAAPTAVVKSKPDQLKCAMLAVGGPWPHTTAKHHLISAMQCYARVRRLARMGSSIGYDINAPPNGIGLPTVANNITYREDLTSAAGGARKKFGKFADPGKRVIAFAVMEQAGAQWHVGHHAVTVEIPEDWADEVDEEDVGHEVSYDESVIKLLLDLTETWVDRCADMDDESENLKADLNQVSDAIEVKLNQFNGDEPWMSSPFFVSRLAFDFAVEKHDGEDEEEEEEEEEDDPKPKKKLKVG